MEAVDFRAGQNFGEAQVFATPLDYTSSRRQLHCYGTAASHTHFLGPPLGADRTAGLLEEHEETHSSTERAYDETCRQDR